MRQSCTELMEQLEKAQNGNTSTANVDTMAEQLLEQAEQENNLPATAAAHYFFAFYRYKTSQYEEAMVSGRRAVQLCERHPECADYLIRVCNLMGILSSLTGKYYSSLEYYLRSYQASKAMHDNLNQAKCLNNVGDLFATLHDHEGAFSYFERALHRLDKCEGYPPVLRAVVILNIIECLLLIGCDDEAKSYIAMTNDWTDMNDKAIVECIVLSNDVLLAQREGDRAAMQEKLWQLLHRFSDALEWTHVYNALIRVRDAVESQSDMELYAAYCSTLLTAAQKSDDTDCMLQYWDVVASYYAATGNEKAEMNALQQYRALNKQQKAQRDASLAKSLSAKVELDRTTLDRNAIKRENETLAVLSSEDSLTSLLNRRAIRERIMGVLRIGAMGSNALMILDMDHFKRINDTYGHLAGDAALLALAGVLRTCFNNDLIGRLGGDEFLMFVSAPGTSEQDLRRRLQTQLEALCEAVRAIRLNGYPELRLSVSVGVRINTVVGADFTALYHDTDVALYRAKDAGRNGFCFFETN